MLGGAGPRPRRVGAAMAASASGSAAGPPDGSCVLCCGELEVVALGRCDHPICYRCSVRMRALCGVRYCAVCREELGQVRPGPAPSYPAGPGLFPPPRPPQPPSPPPPPAHNLARGWTRAGCRGGAGPRGGRGRPRGGPGQEPGHGATREIC